MVAKKRITAASSCCEHVVPIESFAEQLESLYARRSAVEALIQSLEDYHSLCAKRVEARELKTA
jgi:hypothetical protein